MPTVFSKGSGAISIVYESFFEQTVSFYRLVTVIELSLFCARRKYIERPCYITISIYILCSKSKRRGCLPRRCLLLLLLCYCVIVLLLLLLCSIFYFVKRPGCLPRRWFGSSARHCCRCNCSLRRTCHKQILVNQTFQQQQNHQTLQNTSQKFLLQALQGFTFPQWGCRCRRCRQRWKKMLSLLPLKFWVTLNIG